jgi:hypothetical protein
MKVQASNAPELSAALTQLAGGAKPADPPSPAPLAASATPPASSSTSEAAPPQSKFVAPDEVSQKPESPPASSQTQEPSGTKELREAYEARKAELATLKATGDATTKELETARKELQASKERLQALEPLEPKVKDYEKRLLSAEERLRIADYTQSEEFHGKFTKPLAEASQSAERWISQLKVKTDDEGHGRQATAQDFKALLGLDYGTAFETAKQMFGPELAGRVMAHYEKVQDVLIQRKEALDNAALRSQEWVQERQTRETQTLAERRTAFNRISEELAQKNKTIYLPPEGDQEAIEAYKVGVRLADLALEPDPNMTQEEVMTTLAKVRHRAASFPLIALKAVRQEREIEQLKAKLARYESSEPQGGKNPVAQPEPVQNDFSSRIRSDLEKIASRRV